MHITAEKVNPQPFSFDHVVHSFTFINYAINSYGVNSCGFLEMSYFAITFILNYYTDYIGSLPIF